MKQVVPTVTATTVEEYHEQMAVAEFAPRLHIDLADGKFAGQLLDPSEIWWPEASTADVHLMYHYPLQVLEPIVAQKPDLVIFHAEAKQDLSDAIALLKQNYIRVGIALLQQTEVESARELIMQADHAMIFSGTLGSYGGSVDMALLRKVPLILTIKPDIEISWDGGINIDNIRKLCEGGIDVLNVGGAIQHANYPENAYRDLRRQLYGTDSDVAYAKI